MVTVVLKLVNFLVVTAFLQVVLGSALNRVDVCNNKNVGIIGGHRVAIKNAPFIAALYYEDTETSEHKLFCGGSIIHERFILTAAHCLYIINLFHDDPAKRVLVGAKNLTAAEKFIDVEKEICHEDYSLSSNKAADICLLKLKNPVRLGRRVAKIGLPEEDFALEAGTFVNVTGYGRIGDQGNEKKELRQTTIPIKSDECCRKLYNNINDKQFCAGSRGHDSCKGDSGGPVTYRGLQVGVVSYGESCTDSRAGVYVRVMSYSDWIDTNIKNNL